MRFSYDVTFTSDLDKLIVHFAVIIFKLKQESQPADTICIKKNNIT